MKAFAQLVYRLEEVPVKERYPILVDYFRRTESKDFLYAFSLLAGFVPKRLFPVAELRHTAIGIAGIPEWLFMECMETTGELTEALSLILPEQDFLPGHTLNDCMTNIGRASMLSPGEKQAWLMTVWTELDGRSRYILNRLISGTFRSKMSKSTLAEAVADAKGFDKRAISRILADGRDPRDLSPEDMSPSSTGQNLPGPLPFHPMLVLDDPSVIQDRLQDWIALPRYDGIRVQLIIGQGIPALWSANEELLDPHFPEILEAAAHLPPDSIFEGILLAFREHPLDCTLLEKRLKRKRVTTSLIEEVPVVLIFDDVLRIGGKDLRSLDLGRRMELLEPIVGEIGKAGVFGLAEILKVKSLDSLSLARLRSVENPAGGLILKEILGTYWSGDISKPWWVWEPEPFTAKMVLLYASFGQGYHSGLFEDLTFGVKRGDEFISVCKISPELDDEDLRELDALVRSTTIEKFGPVRVLKPEQVFSISFGAIIPSSRHKCGFMLKDTYINGWLRDEGLENVFFISELTAFIPR